MAIEAVGRWPAVIRSVIEVALSKRAGGARLIGLAASLYRLWARVRYSDIRAELEGRMARPELAAAPGRGAAQAAFELALATETATAKEQVAATSMFDIKKYFEYVDIAEYAAPAKKIGLPKQLLSLTSHFYMGPRRIRVSGAYSRAILPSRSIVAGCTWCTVYVRLAVLAPIDGLNKQLKRWARTWGTEHLFRLYIDDGALTTFGPRDNVTLVHSWASIYLLGWVRGVLWKMVAEDKLQCVAADRELRHRLRQRLGHHGYRVCKLGDLLGTDYGAGGRLRRRPKQDARRRKARKRKGRLKWWARAGGAAAHIVDTGTAPSMVYGTASSGLTPAAMRDLRRYRGAFARGKAKGASLTARLAVDGNKSADSDPAVLYPNPPLRALHDLLWDFPKARHSFVYAWRGAVRMAEQCNGVPWKHINGPVSAATCHLLQLGATWPAPFRVKLGEHVVDLLTTPPLQLHALLQDRARVCLDTSMIQRLASQRAWNGHEVVHRYRYGIDWELIRSILEARTISPISKRALRVAITGSFWSDEKRWLAGYAADPGCTLCGEAVGDNDHFYAGHCPAVQDALLWERIAGRTVSTPSAFADPALAPLCEMGLPPRTTPWKPRPVHPECGYLTMGRDARMYGDGSGYRQASLSGRVATWSVIRLGDEEGGEETLRGWLHGFFPTVPRAETTAIIKAIIHAGPNASYGGDCEHVLEAVRQGVPQHMTSSRCFNADLWREARRLLHDRGSVPDLVKIKAHVSASAAAAAGADLRDWHGNKVADDKCKSIAREEAEADREHSQAVALRATYRHTIDRIVFITRWSFRYRQQYAKNGGKERSGRKGTTVHRHSQHQIVAIDHHDDRWRCVHCRREAWSNDTLRHLQRTPCAGPIAGACHVSHQLDVLRGVLWCRGCGAYTTRRPRALKRPCPMHPGSPAAANVLGRLRAGLLPTTARYLRQASIAEGFRNAAHRQELPRPRRGGQRLDALDDHGCLDDNVDLRNHVPVLGGGVAAPPPPPPPTLLMLFLAEWWDAVAPVNAQSRRTSGLRTPLLPPWPTPTATRLQNAQPAPATSGSNRAARATTRPLATPAATTMSRLRVPPGSGGGSEARVRRQLLPPRTAKPLPTS